VKIAHQGQLVCISYEKEQKLSVFCTKKYLVLASRLEYNIKYNSDIVQPPLQKITQCIVSYLTPLTVYIG
jgi:hypothetical protein